MKTTDLLDLARHTGVPLSEYARRLGLSDNALSKAKSDGRLSPAVAATLAAELGENVHQWVMQAVLESERSAPLRRRLAPLARVAKS